jgi:cytochrome P450
VDKLLEPLRDAHSADLVRELTYPLPVTVISALLGVPIADRDQFKQWTYEIFAIFSSGRAYPDIVTLGSNSLREMRAYLSDLIASRRREPHNDLVSHLVAVEEGGERLTADELLGNCVLLFVAGHETTTGLIGNALVALLRNPDQLRLLRQNPDLIVNAVEEFLRYDGSIQRNWRVTTRDVTVGDKQIRAGQMVSQMLGAANRDPAQFPDPHKLNLARKENRHLGFGYGIHFCVGAPLARLEAQIAVNTVVQRFPRLELAAAAVEWRPDYTFRTLKSLPVVF